MGGGWGDENSSESWSFRVIRFAMAIEHLSRRRNEEKSLSKVCKSLDICQLVPKLMKAKVEQMLPFCDTSHNTLIDTIEKK